MSIIENFEKMLAAGQDTALLRYGLGQAYLNAGDAHRGVVHLLRAVEHDPAYSAAWKLLGKAQTEAGDIPGAIDSYTRGIDVAQTRGDIQAAKEMTVFRKRLEKQRSAD